MHGITSKLILVAKIAEEDEGKDFLDGGKSELLPYQGNIAYVLAAVAALDKAVPDLVGQKPIEIKLPSERSNLGAWITFRLTVPLVLVDNGNKDKLLRHPEFALTLLGCNFDEVKTSGWRSQRGCITGYACIPQQYGAVFLGLSGSGGIFVLVQNLKKDVVNYPNVVWETPLQTESEVQFFKSVQKA